MYILHYFVTSVHFLDNIIIRSFRHKASEQINSSLLQLEMVELSRLPANKNLTISSDMIAVTQFLWSDKIVSDRNIIQLKFHRNYVDDDLKTQQQSYTTVFSNHITQGLLCPGY